MKVRYAIRRTINLGNFENIVLEFELEGEYENMRDIEAEVEDFIEHKEAEIRAQIK